MVRCAGVCLFGCLVALVFRGVEVEEIEETLFRAPSRRARIIFLHIYSVVASQLEHYLQRYVRGAQ